MRSRIIPIRLVKIIIAALCSIIPCGIHIIIAIIQTNDIPCVAFSRITRTIITGNFQRLQNILKRPRISGTYRLSVHQRTVCTLVHCGRIHIINLGDQRVMHIFLFFIIASEFLRTVNNLLCFRLKRVPRLLQVFGRRIEFQIDFHALSVALISAGIGRLHKKQLRMVIIDRCKYVPECARRHIFYRRKPLIQCHGICINLTVKMLSRII